MKHLSNKNAYNDSNTLQQNLVEFTRSLNLLKNRTEHLKNLTKKQASSKLWLEQRWGRITASDLHRICSSMITITKKNR